MRSTADQVRQRVRRGARQRFWTPADFDGARTAVDKALSRMAADGDLLRVRKGLYWRGLDTILGMSPPSPYDIVRHLADGEPVGPAGLSAANVLGLTTQMRRRPVVAVSGMAGRKVEGIDLIHRDGRRAAARRRARATDTDIAVLETLNDWVAVSETATSDILPTLVNAIRMTKDDKMPQRLALASAGEPGVVRARLQQLLRDCGAATQADRVPPADPRDVARALAGAV